MAEKKTPKKVSAKAATTAETPAKGSGKTRAALKREARAAHFKAAKADNPFTKARPYASYMAPNNRVERHWYLVDADGLVLGRAASRIAHILRGKHKPAFTPHTDVGDFVVVINAEKVRLTGNKEADKPYYRHSLFPGGLKTTQARDVRARQPEELILQAVRRMIPRSPLGRQQFTKLKVYAGPPHPHQAPRPEAHTLAR